MISNFIYQNPVKIIFGRETIQQISKNIPKNANVLLTYGGGSIFENSVYDQVEAALVGYNVVKFGGIEPNPTYENLLEAVKLAKENNIDFVLSVGGGSVLDGSKFIAMAIKYEGSDAWSDIVKGKAKLRMAVPLGCVMTLPATGSEMNYFSVISKKSTQEKTGFGNPAIYPQFSILDPETTYSLPKTQIANGIADAFTHVMEQYMTFDSGAIVQDNFAEGVLKTLIQIAPKALSDEKDYNTMANYMWAATVALNGWISVGVPQDWATHQIGHELTALHGIDHARSLAIVIPHLMRYKKETKREKLIRYSRNVWNETGSDDELVEKAISSTVKFYESLGIPTNGSAYNINSETIKEIKSRFSKSGLSYGENKDITPEAVEDILIMSIT